MSKAVLRCSRQKGKRLRKPENHIRVETGLVIRPFTVKVNCQIRGLASIRKGLGTKNTPFLVSSYSIIASENVSRRVAGRDLFLPIRKSPIFGNPEGSQFCQSGRILFLPIRKGPILPISKGPIFANLEGSCFCQSGGVLFLSKLK